MRVLVLLAALCWAATGSAQVLELKPANPQPTGLKQGLAVSYAFPAEVKSLKQAAKHAKKAKPGKPLAGLDYEDTRDGQPTLTARSAHKVVAKISGYVKFEKPGTYTIEFLSNDGLRASIGGKEVVFFDGRHPCEPGDPVQAKVPSAGWYELEALYFQRFGSACLHMLAGIGDPDWMPNTAFGY